MTHPGGGAGGSRPPHIANLDAATRAQRQRVAAIAGARGTSAPPMTAEARTDKYTRQRNGGSLTARQRRRIGAKARRAEVRTA